MKKLFSDYKKRKKKDWNSKFHQCSRNLIHENKGCKWQSLINPYSSTCLIVRFLILEILKTTIYFHSLKAPQMNSSLFIIDFNFDSEHDSKVLAFLISYFSFKIKIYFVSIKAINIKLLPYIDLQWLPNFLGYNLAHIRKRLVWLKLNITFKIALYILLQNASWFPRYNFLLIIYDNLGNVHGNLMWVIYTYWSNFKF